MSINRQSGVLMLIPSVLIAIAIVFGLLFLMQFLISQNLEEPEENTGPQIADIFQEAEEIEDQVKQREIEEIDTPEDPPPDIPRQDIEIEDVADAIDISTGSVGAAVELTLGGSSGDGDIIPLVAIQPQYPRRAAERGITGYVVVGFVITTQGTTRDIEVLESTNSLFDSASTRAAERLKYKPRIIDGTPVEVDHFFKFTFELEN